MVYSLHKFYHYFFNNRFVFYVDSMTLTYLLNKPLFLTELQDGYYCFWNMTLPSHITQGIFTRWQMPYLISLTTQNHTRYLTRGRCPSIHYTTWPIVWCQDLPSTGVFLNSYPLEYKRRIALKALYSMLLEGKLHYLGQDRVLRRYLELNEAITIITELHKGVGGSHFSIEITIRIFLDAHYWWPTIYKDSLHLCRSCDECQKTRNLTFTVTKLVTTPLSNSFMKWGLNLLGL